VIGLLAQAAAGAALVPPRPNLGPEPMHAPALGLATVLGFAAALIIMGSLLRRLAWRRRQARARRLATGADPGAQPALPTSLRLRSIVYAEMLRHALVTRFGPKWAARTTEEIVAEPDVAALLGPERTEQLARLLRAGDCAKFAAERLDATQGDDWETLVPALVEAIAPAAAAGATSTINGK
jgi:hypothetical protein